MAEYDVKSEGLATKDRAFEILASFEEVFYGEKKGLKEVGGQLTGISAKVDGGIVERKVGGLNGHKVVVEEIVASKMRDGGISSEKYRAAMEDIKGEKVISIELKGAIATGASVVETQVSVDLLSRAVAVGIKRGEPINGAKEVVDSTDNIAEGVRMLKGWIMDHGGSSLGLDTFPVSGEGFANFGI